MKCFVVYNKKENFLFTYVATNNWPMNTDQARQGIGEKELRLVVPAEPSTAWNTTPFKGDPTWLQAQYTHLLMHLSLAASLHTRHHDNHVKTALCGNTIINSSESITCTEALPKSCPTGFSIKSPPPTQKRELWWGQWTFFPLGASMPTFTFHYVLTL